MPGTYFDLQGHRGARGLFPENTIEGFRAALGIGVAAFELDIALTADGVPVVHHDPALNPDIARGPDGRWLADPTPLLHELTAADLGQYDVGRLRPGSPYAARYPNQRPMDGARIPRLAEVLRIGPTVRFTIELKTDPRAPGRTASPEVMADAVMADIEAADAVSRVMVESFDWRGPRHLRRTRPEIRLAWLTTRETVRDAALWWGGPRAGDYDSSVPRAVAAEANAFVANDTHSDAPAHGAAAAHQTGRVQAATGETGARQTGRRGAGTRARGAGVARGHDTRPAWAPDHLDLTHHQLAEAHALGLAVIPWTVNDPAVMRRLIAWGADGLITDRPDLARHEMQAANLDLPPVRPG